MKLCDSESKREMSLSAHSQAGYSEIERRVERRRGGMIGRTGNYVVPQEDT